MKHLIITVIGKDRAGLVEQLSDTIYQHKGHWQGSSLSQLAGQFAGILQAEVPAARYPSLLKALAQIEDLQIQTAEVQVKAAKPQDLHQLIVTGNDRPGIVKEVTTKLSQLGINIYKLKTRTQSAPNWGYPIFSADFQLELPGTVDLALVQQELENIADDLTIDIDEASDIEQAS